MTALLRRIWLPLVALWAAGVGHSGRSSHDETMGPEMMSSAGVIGTDDRAESAIASGVREVSEAVLTRIMRPVFVRESSMPRARRTRILWSRSDLKLLRSLAGRKSASRIARALRRTEQAVRFKAHKHRISLAVRGSR